MDNLLVGTTKIKANILHDILLERDKQDKKWGNQHHNFYKWMSILGEEIGEANKAVLDYDIALNEITNNYLYGKTNKGDVEQKYKELRNELIQSAAVIVQILEHMDSEGIEI